MIFNISDSIKALQQWTKRPQDTLLCVNQCATEEKIIIVHRYDLNYYSFVDQFFDSNLDLATIILTVRKHLNIKKDLTNTTLKLLESKIKAHNSSCIRSLFGYTIPPLQTNNDEIQFITISVKNHLKPYQEGKITKKTDPKNRPSFTSLITKRFYSQFPASSRLPNDLVKKAFEEYLLEGIRGYQHIIGKKIPHATRYNPYIAKLVVVFGNAFQKDFPKFNDIPQDLFTLVQTGIRIVNNETTISFQQLEKLRFEEELKRIIDLYPRLSNNPLTKESPLKIATAIFLDIEKEFPDYENRPKNIAELTKQLQREVDNVLDFYT